MNGIPFSFLTKYSKFSYALAFILLGVGVQFTVCYKNVDSTWSLQQQQPLEQPESYDFYQDTSQHQDISSGRSSIRSKNATSRDYSSLTNPSSSSGYSVPKPGGFVAYHRSIHNTSWAITIPLFTFLLPTANVNDPLNVGNQLLYGFFAIVITVISFAVPILFNGHNPTGRSMDESKLSLDHLMHPGRVMNLAGLNIGNQVGIDPSQCLQKTICESYRYPQRYGALVWPFRYFFPAGNETDSTGLHSIYRMAAREGKFSKSSCKKKYDCMFDILDLANYLLSVYKKTRKRGNEDINSETIDNNVLSKSISYR